MLQEQAMLSENEIRRIVAEAGRVTVKDAKFALDRNHKGNYCKKLCSKVVKDLKADMKGYC